MSELQNAVVLVCIRHVVESELKNLRRAREFLDQTCRAIRYVLDDRVNSDLAFLGLCGQVEHCRAHQPRIEVCETLAAEDPARERERVRRTESSVKD